MPVTGAEEGVMSTGARPWPAGDISEVALLLPSSQVEALERAASRHGITVGHLLRLMVKLHLELGWENAPAGTGS